MAGDDRVATSAEPSNDGGSGQESGGLHRLMKALSDLAPWNLKRRIEDQETHLNHVQVQIDGVENRLDAIEEGVRHLQTELGEVRDTRLGPAETRLDTAESAISSVTGETTRLRDEVVPAMIGRSDALLERLASELDELGSMVERMLLREPLPVPGEGAIDEAKLASALTEVQPALLEAFRGPEAEIRHRLDRYLEQLKTNAPVLDLGCGRGELLLMLREAGVDAMGIEGDAAVAQASRRRGLQVIEADVLEGLRSTEDASRGAVTAIHLFEHLEPATLLAVLAEVRRVLRPGGVLIAESPNPHSLRVGAALYWADPTHRRPLLPETLALYVKTAGLEVDGCEFLHPFPDDQLFSHDGGGTTSDEDPDLAALQERFENLSQRLDDLINGPRDFVLRARRTNTTTT